MLSRFLAAAAFATLAASAASAGTLQNGVWTPNCTMPGDAPAFSSKSPEAYNKSAKAAQDWQASAKAYADCLNTEAKTDQQAIVTVANDNVKKLSDQITALNTASAAAVDALKKKGGAK
jgi:hypothetical protein